MSAVFVEVAVILMLLALNGVFAMSEMALVAARKIRLEHRADEGDAGARAALALAANPTNFLSTVQVGITLVGILAGAFGGAGLADRMGDRLATAVPVLEPYADAIALAAVVGAITYLSLIIGELVPKQLALRDPERVAALVARPMSALSRIGGPIVRFLTASTNLVFRVLGIRATVDPRVTEQDIRATVEQGAEAGVIAPAEHEIIENTFRLGDRQVVSLMTPRLDIAWVDVDSTQSDLLGRLAATGDAPLVVCDGDVDRVVGIAYADHLLIRHLAGESFDLRAALRPPMFVPATMPALRLLEQFRRTRERAALVLDEFGGVQGLVTLDDILEALVGDMPDVGEVEPPPIARQPDGTLLVEGSVAVEELEAALDVDDLGGERRDFRTVAGLIMTHLGHVPRVGEAAVVDAIRFEVAEMDGRRVSTVRVIPPRRQ